ncbi:hypothetical protein jhhlp_005138 [Lomentospora prolificans]|uniref:Uncharacterized protein n=1 Tax=Lomentospora prolificans TaxID=41688 RepID=A0A2N3N7Q4_9PEZI|nr:hypothetical protein jhhlp_005138 [Lomentospora prolificans]
MTSRKSTKSPSPAVSSPRSGVPAASAPIAADPQFDDGGAEDDAASVVSEEFESTASLTDSIRDFRNIHGRTYGNSKTTEYW